MEYLENLHVIWFQGLTAKADRNSDDFSLMLEDLRWNGTISKLGYERVKQLKNLL